MWRAAVASDDEAIVGMCLRLNADDPGPAPVPPEHTRRTLVELRRDPERGRALILEIDGAVCGYALLIAFWSNELGGEVTMIDELYVDEAHRGHGHATQLLASLQNPVALEVSLGNARARRLYEKLGFSVRSLTMIRASS